DVPELRGRAVRLAEARAAAREELAETLIALGRHPEAVSSLLEVVAAEPLREHPRGLLMRALYGAGRQAEALAVYEEGRRLLADELGTDPSAELAEIQLRILRGVAEPGRVEGVAVESAAETSRGRLPAQLTSFVGREEDVGRVAALSAEARLVTLLGPGGAGKTRLSVEVGRRLSGEIVFVDLAPVAAGAGDGALAQAVNGALGLREAGVLPGGQQAEPVERLTMALSGREITLVLDNCEHVIGGAAAFTGGLLAACPGLRVIATSREALGVTGERVWPVRQLGVPEADDVDAVAAPAVRLFADRAAAVDPGFVVDAANVAAVVRICSALDGQPLAIELAAARLRTLTVQEVADRLGDRFRLLSRGDRSKSPRHQTLRAVVEWSWGLLDEQEQTLARRLTVFNGGFLARSAESVCDADEDVLLDLADKSLIVRGADGRFRMLDTIGAYCAERLADAGEAERLRRAHAEHFLAVAAEADAGLRTAEQVGLLDRLAAEGGNLSAALRWSIENDEDLALRYVQTLSGFWWLRGERSEAAEAARILLDKTGGFPKPGREEEFVACVANLALGSQPADDLPELVERANLLLNGFRRRLRQPFLLAMWALAAGPPDGYEGAEENDLLDRRRPQFEGEPWGEALMRLGLGFMRMFTGAPQDAAAPLNEALAAFSALGERWGMTQTQDALATLAEITGDFDTAIDLRERALALLEELGTATDTAEMLVRRADLLARTGRVTEARADYVRAGEIARRSGAQGVTADVYRGHGDLAFRDGDLAEAEARYVQAMAACPPRWYSAELIARCHLGLARVFQARGDADAARHSARQAAEAASHHFTKSLITEAARLLSTL
ncbi:ATP-binding protein, partial [Actinocorallia lasiicapitis]